MLLASQQSALAASGFFIGSCPLSLCGIRNGQSLDFTVMTSLLVKMRSLLHVPACVQ